MAKKTLTLYDDARSLFHPVILSPCKGLIYAARFIPAALPDEKECRFHA